MPENNKSKREHAQKPACGQAADVIIVSGMSGSGRTQVLHVFEDMGYYCIDNLPPHLIMQLAHIVGINNGVSRHLAVACDLRSQGFLDELGGALKDLKAHNISYKLIFLDCSDEVLCRRYDENRRRHPLQQRGKSISAALARERALLNDVKDCADVVIDTSHMRTSTLRARIRKGFSELKEQQLMDVRVLSFGYKYGLPNDVDLMIDVRFLPNPFYDPAMRNLTGLDDTVAAFVLDHPTTKEFMKAWEQLLDTVMPGYVAEGKPQLSLAIGCTGGQHRSVAIAHKTALYLSQRGYKVALIHRDLPLARPRADELDAQ